MFSFAMASVVRPLFRLLLSLAFIVGVSAQLVPIAIAHGDLSAHGHMSSGCDQPQPPCPGHLSNCVDHVGCVASPVVPASPATISARVAWMALDYDPAPGSLLGISVKPELSPPIFAA